MKKERGEELDYDLLNSILDSLVELRGNKLPSARVMDEVQVEFDKSLQKLILTVFHRMNWNKASDNRTRRPSLCVRCMDTTCNHIMERRYGSIIDDAIAICDHEIDDDDLFRCCIDCLKAMTKGVEDDWVRNLWDTVDLAEFYVQLIQMNLEYGLHN